MRRTHRALAMLALGGLVLIATTITAAAEPSAPDGNSEQATQRKALYESELEHNLQLRGHSVAPVTDTTAAELSEAEQRSIARIRDPYIRTPDPITPTDRADPAVPGSDVDVLASLLLGLAGGLVGGAAAAIVWTTSTRRRLPHPAAGT